MFIASGNLDLKFHKYFNNSSVPYFNFPLVEIFILTTLIIGLLAFTNIRITLNCKYLDTTSLFPRITLFLIGCFIAGFAWVALMKNHAAIHLHLIPSQLILLFIGLLVFISVILNEENWCKILYTEEKK